VNRNPRREAGDTTGQGRAIGPARRNRSVGGRFRVPSFSVRRQNRFDETRRPGRSVLPCDTGRFSVRCCETINCHEETPSCPSSGKVALTGTPPNASRRVRLDLPVAQLDDGRESPAGEERPEAAISKPGRNLEEGGSGGNGWRQRRPRSEGAGPRRRGKPQRRLSVRPAGGGR
jgi:hypothetical protein